MGTEALGIYERTPKKLMTTTYGNELLRAIRNRPVDEPPPGDTQKGEDIYIAVPTANLTGGGKYTVKIYSRDLLLGSSEGYDYPAEHLDYTDNHDLYYEGAILANLAEDGQSTHLLPLNKPVLCVYTGVDTDETPCFECYVPGKTLYGKPSSAFSSGTTITLVPCSIEGTATGESNVDVYVQKDKSSYSMTNSTTVATTTVVHYTVGADGAYYVLGMPVEVMTNFDINTGGNLKYRKKTRNTWGAWGGEESDWVDIITGTACS
jgi:hypothetical protein